MGKRTAEVAELEESVSPIEVVSNEGPYSFKTTTISASKHI